MNFSRDQWEHFFDSVRRSRGKSYYYAGDVENVEKIGNTFLGEVSGSSIYDVKIDTDGYNVTSASCSCPDAKKGHWCKHEAALLYYLSDPLNGVIEELERKSQAVKRAVDKNLKEASKEELVRIINGFLDDHPELAEHLYSESDLALEPTLQNEAEDEEMDFNQRIEAILGKLAALNMALEEANEAYDEAEDNYYDEDYGYAWGYEPYSGYADSYAIEEKAAEYENKIDDILDNEFYELFIVENAREAFDFYFKWLDKCDNSPKTREMRARERFSMDLNNGIDYLLDDINDDLKEDLSEKAFEWFKKLPGEMGNHLSKAYAKMCRRLFSPEQVGELSEIFLDKRIKRKAESHLPFLQDLKDMVDLMYEIGKTDEEVDEYLAAYKETPEYKKALLKQAELKGDTEEAIRLLEDIEGIAGKRGGSRENSKRLIELYEQSGLTDKLINELKYHINRFPTFSTEMLPKLKPLLPPDEWGEYVQEALGDTKYSEGKAEIYAADGDYGKILEMVLKDNPSSEGLYRKYETILNREFPEEIGKWRVSKLDIAMRAANSRTLYQEVAFRLLGLKDMPGGPELISETIERWKNEYPKRRAMIEELDNIKPYLM